jgi:hypothetical protein
VTGQLQQQYHVRRFETHQPAFPVLDFSSVKIPSHPQPVEFTCQMFIQSLMSARLMIYRADQLLAGNYAVNRVWPIRMPIRLKSITYTISACGDGNGIETQDFVHPFYGVTMLLLAGEIRSQDGPLFKRDDLNNLLDSRAFGKVKGIQFVA